MNSDLLPVVMLGTFIYGGTIECDVRIVRSGIRFGTGYHGDPPEIQDDVAIETFYAEYESTTQRGVFNSTSFGYPSLAEAIAATEAALAVQWRREA